MTTLLVIIFLIGYASIVFEHKLSIDKSASSILTGVALWTIAAINYPQNPEHTVESLMHHVGEIAGILFFLMAAMTIVELMDSYGGFEIITNQINTRNKSKLLWVICFFTFFLSSLLDNLTTTIIMVTLCRKLIEDRKTRLIYAGLIVIAANAGGAWSPIGDVTTTMLWIGNQVTSKALITSLFLPSVVSLLVPVLLMSFSLKGDLDPIKISKEKDDHQIDDFERGLIFWIGILGLIFVPIFKSITHLPPFMGILFSLGVLWAVAEIIQKNKDQEFKIHKSVLSVLRKIDMASILFFLGILLAVGALESTGVLSSAATWLSANVKNQEVLLTFIGLLSSIVDNVPLVAAAMGMYTLEQFPTDDSFWRLLAFCAGTGGSLLIIGSAAGVAAMGIEKIEFFWYVKKISWLAALGYFAGIGVYLIQQAL